MKILKKQVIFLTFLLDLAMVLLDLGDLLLSLIDLLEGALVFESKELVHLLGVFDLVDLLLHLDDLSGFKRLLGGWSKGGGYRCNDSSGGRIFDGKER